MACWQERTLTACTSFITYPLLKLVRWSDPRRSHSIAAGYCPGSVPGGAGWAGGVLGFVSPEGLDGAGAGVALSPEGAVGVPGLPASSQPAISSIANVRIGIRSRFMFTSFHISG
jgi:hypothetical protein